jgi:peptidoglycan/LPS O-acetylase OafA/YrhL
MTSLSSTENSPRIAALDGLRALSIALVLVGHSRKQSDSPILWSFFGDCIANHRLGVSLFFVISGFIITWLLRR